MIANDSGGRLGRERTPGEVIRGVLLDVAGGDDWVDTFLPGSELELDSGLGDNLHNLEVSELYMVELLGGLVGREVPGT